MKKNLLFLVPFAALVFVLVNSLFWYFTYVWNVVALVVAVGTGIACLVKLRNGSIPSNPPIIAAFIVVALMAAIGIKVISPELSTSAVQSIARAHFSGLPGASSQYYVSGARYHGEAVWTVTYLRQGFGWFEVDFNESTGKFGQTRSVTVVPTATQSRATQDWNNIRAAAGYDGLVALNKVWAGAALMPTETAILQAVYQKYPLGQTNFDIWMKQTVRQTFEKFSAEYTADQNKGK